MQFKICACSSSPCVQINAEPRRGVRWEGTAGAGCPRVPVGTYMVYKKFLQKQNQLNAAMLFYYKVAIVNKVLLKGPSLLFVCD